MNTKQQNTSNAAPTHTTRAGNIRASVWETQSDTGESRFKIVISRLFKQGESWQRGHTFYADNLAAVIEAASKAQQWIERRRQPANTPVPQKS